jgi:hypothetical protein
MHRKREKRMRKEEFSELIQRHQWAPRRLAQSQYPDLFKNIPREKVLWVAISGSFEDIRDEGRIGGVSIFRYDESNLEKGYPLNKDQYYVLLDDENSNYVVVEGPFKDHEHWLACLPQWLMNAECYPYDAKTEQYPSTP